MIAVEERSSLKWFNIDTHVKSQISHRARRELRDNVLTLFILSWRSLRLCAR